MPDDVPDRQPRRRGRGRPLLLAGTALAALTAGAGIALAATSGPPASPAPAAGSPGALNAATSSPAPSAAAPPAARPGCLRVVTPRRAGLLCRRPGLPDVLHGTVVLPAPGGRTVTVEIQNGEVTSVSPSSITLKSEDGYTRIYAVTGSTIVDARREGIGSVRTGDEVLVTATASGGTVTAIRVRDLSQLAAGPGGLPGPAGPAVPAPRGSTAASSSGAAGG